MISVTIIARGEHTFTYDHGHMKWIFEEWKEIPGYYQGNQICTSNIDSDIYLNNYIILL